MTLVDKYAQKMGYKNELDMLDKIKIPNSYSFQGADPYAFAKIQRNIIAALHIIEDDKK